MSAPTPEQLLAALRAEGVRIREVDGWRSRGYAELEPKFVVNHHTAGGTAPTDQRDVDEQVKGRPDLRGPLSNFFVGKDGTVHLIALRRARHAGKGVKVVFEETLRDVAPSGDARDRGFTEEDDETDGNRNSWGIEVDHPGDASAYPDIQIDALVRLNTALCRLAGWTSNRCVHHREWTVRKPDMSLRSADIRALVAARLRPDQDPLEDTPMKYAKADVTGNHPERGRVYAVTALGRTWMKSGRPHMDWLAAHDLGPQRNPATGDFDIEKWPVENLLQFPLLGAS